MIEGEDVKSQIRREPKLSLRTREAFLRKWPDSEHGKETIGGKSIPSMECHVQRVEEL